MVWVNAPLLDNDAGPFGGRKLSGMAGSSAPRASTSSATLSW